MSPLRVRKDDGSFLKWRRTNRETTLRVKNEPGIYFTKENDPGSTTEPIKNLLMDEPQPILLSTTTYLFPNQNKPKQQ